MKARIAEVFQSIQGEGPYVGKAQIFIRFYGCNLNHCRFCDTRLDKFEEYGPEELLNHLKCYPGDFHSVSLTGGEPLVQECFLKEFLPLIRQKGLTAYLETNATLPSALNDIIGHVDIIAMDFKLPSSTGLRGFWQEHKDCLGIAWQKEVFVKAVICHSTDITDLNKAVELLSNLKRNIPFILQPNSFELDRLLMDKIQEFKRYSLQFLADVRIIPQMHKVLSQAKWR